jgi:hypothetical protein
MLPRAYFKMSADKYLINVSGRVVEDPQHRDQTVGGSVGSGDVRAGSTNAVDVDADSAGRLGDEGTLLERVVDAFDRVSSHGQQKAARGKVGSITTCISLKMRLGLAEERDI